MGAKSIDEYVILPYTIEVIRDTNEENPGWVARVVELPGCITQGDTFEELQAMVEDAMRLWIGTALEDGLTIPEPRSEEEYSGKFIVRMPKSLHRQLVIRAEREETSLNQYVSAILAGAAGMVAGRTSEEAQPSAPDLKALIKEAVSEALGEMEMVLRERHPSREKAAVPGGLFASAKVAVHERIDAEYAMFLENAGRAFPGEKLTSSTLDHLNE